MIVMFPVAAGLADGFSAGRDGKLPDRSAVALGSSGPANAAELAVQAGIGRHRRGGAARPDRGAAFRTAQSVPAGCEHRG